MLKIYGQLDKNYGFFFYKCLKYILFQLLCYHSKILFMETFINIIIFYYKQWYFKKYLINFKVLTIFNKKINSYNSTVTVSWYKLKS